MELVYLASPYTHKEARVREERYRAAVEAAGKLMRGYAVFSPIAHTHNIGLKMDREVDHSFWMQQDIAILRRCDRVFVLTLDGWDKSKGVNEEILLATRLNIPVTYVKLEHL